MIIPVNKRVENAALVLDLETIEERNILKVSKHIKENTFMPFYAIKMKDGSVKAFTLELLEDFKFQYQTDGLALEKFLLNQNLSFT